MKNKAKSSNPSKSYPELSKNKHLHKYGTLKHLDYWKKISKKEKIEEVTEFLSDYLSDPKNTDIYSGLVEYGMPSSTYRLWLTQSPELKAMHREFKLMVARNLLEKAQSRDNQTIQKRLRQHHPDLIRDIKQERLFRKDLSNAKNAAMKDVIIEIAGTKIEKTELVDEAIKRRKNNDKSE